MHEISEEEMEVFLSLAGWIPRPGLMVWVSPRNGWFYDLQDAYQEAIDRVAEPYW
jgi:hypothetical protein